MAGKGKTSLRFCPNSGYANLQSITKHDKNAVYCCLSALVITRPNDPETKLKKAGQKRKIALSLRGVCSRRNPGEKDPSSRFLQKCRVDKRSAIHHLSASAEGAHLYAPSAEG